jgi:hypothetical protein
VAEAIYTLPEPPLEPAPLPSEGEGTYVYNGEHAEQAARQLIEFFRKPRNMEIMRIIGGQVQDLEDTVAQLMVAFDLERATGVVLDLIGGIVGELRGNRENADYRAAVRARILVNSSNGRIEDMIAVLLALDPEMHATIQEFYPAAIRFDVISDFSGASAETMAFMLRQAKPAGVRLTFVPVDSDDTMLWSGTGDEYPDNGWGSDWAGFL